MSLVYKIGKDVTSNGRFFKAGDYSEADLIKIFDGKQGTFNYAIKCTNLKNLVKIYRSAEEKEIIEKIEDIIFTESEPSIKYLVNSDIKKGRKIIFKAGELVSFEDLEPHNIDELLKSEIVIETKVS